MVAECQLMLIVTENYYLDIFLW